MTRFKTPRFLRPGLLTPVSSLLLLPLPLWAAAPAPDTSQIVHEAGRCYLQQYSKNLYKTITDKVVIRDAASSFEVVPARFNDSVEKVKIRDAASRISIEPARFRTEQEVHVVQEGRTDLERIPASFETVEERVLVQAESVQHEVIPATWKTETRKILRREGYKRLEIIPAEGVDDGFVDEDVEIVGIAGEGVSGGEGAGVGPLVMVEDGPAAGESADEG